MPGLKVCAVAGCPQLTAGRWCAAHTTDRGHQWYGTTRWRRLRDQVWADEPFCRLGCGRVTDQIDHIRPHRGDPVLFFDRANCQGLCAEHHAIKTRRGE